MDTPPAARYSPGAVSFALRILNIAATVLTLASGLGVLAQDLFVDGYREYHRDWVAFVAVYCGVQAYTLEQLIRADGRCRGSSRRAPPSPTSSC
jgi:hypothetical protein